MLCRRTHNGVTYGHIFQFLRTLEEHLKKANSGSEQLYIKHFFQVLIGSSMISTSL